MIPAGLRGCHSRLVHLLWCASILVFGESMQYAYCNTAYMSSLNHVQNMYAIRARCTDTTVNVNTNSFRSSYLYLRRVLFEATFYSFAFYSFVWSNHMERRAWRRLHCILAGWLATRARGKVIAQGTLHCYLFLLVFMYPKLFNRKFNSKSSNRSAWLRRCVASVFASPHLFLP